MAVVPEQFLMLAVNSVIDYIHQLLIIHNGRLVFFYQLFVCFYFTFRHEPAPSLHICIRFLILRAIIHINAVPTFCIFRY